MTASARRAPERLRLGKVLGFMRLMWAVDGGLQSASKRMARRFGVTGPQRLAIRILGRTPGLSASRLADVLHMHPSTLTGILQRLEKRGLVQREADRADSRRTRLFLTARGGRLDVPASGTAEEAIRRALSRFGAREVRATSEVLSAIAATLAEIPAGPAILRPRTRRRR